MDGNYIRQRQKREIAFNFISQLPWELFHVKANYFAKLFLHLKGRHQFFNVSVFREGRLGVVSLQGSFLLHCSKKGF